MNTAVDPVNLHTLAAADGETDMPRMPAAKASGRGHSLRQILPFVLRYPALLAAFAVFLLLSSALALTLPAAFKLVIDCSIATPAPGCHPVTQSTLQPFYFIAGLGIAILLGITTALRFYFVSRLGERVVADLRQAVYGRLLTLSPDFYADNLTGELLARLTTDTTLIQSIVGSSLSVTLRSLVTLCGALVLAFAVSWKLALMVLVIGPVILVPVMLYGRRLKRLSRDSQDRLAEASARAGECLHGIQTVQLFTRETDEMAGFARAINATFDAAMRRTRERAVMTSVVFTVMFSGLVLLLWFGALQVSHGDITAGEMTQFVLYAFIVISAAGMLTETFAELKRAAGAAERLGEILATEPAIRSAHNAQTLPRPVCGVIEFEDVSFSYPNAPDACTLQSVSLSVNKGETVALVGPSGAGKSTLFRLLTRLHDPAGGRILLNGIDVKMLELASLRNAFAVVEQEAPLFSGSVLDNIRFGQPDATIEETEAAAQAADAHEFISALPQGYHTRLGENGARLSGGQRQRIAIARAILKNAAVILLDEATSALDAHSEQAVHKAFRSLSRKQTTLIIAHRLATVRHADKIVVMDKGRIVDQGTHDELLAGNGLYAQQTKLLQA